MRRRHAGCDTDGDPNPNAGCHGHASGADLIPDGPPDEYARRQPHSRGRWLSPPSPPDVNPDGPQGSRCGLLDRIPIAIKVSTPSRSALSLTGSADLVFEHYAEGGITRYTTVFYANEPEQGSSVRSGRLIDLEIPAMYHALGHSGSSAGGGRSVSAGLTCSLTTSPPRTLGWDKPYFYRAQAGKAFEHTLFSNPTVLRELAEELGINERPIR